jgi:L-lactate utilization protein LutC
MQTWESLPVPETVDRTAEALRANGFKVEVVPDRESALEKVASLIPDSASVMTGGSTTLDQIGFTALLKSENHPWVNLKGRLLAEKDPEAQTELRRRASFADYFLGSVHAVTENGQLVAGSATGSQLAAYAYNARNLILVAGTHKITQNLETALERLREHSLPLEDKRMKSIGWPGSVLSKIFIYESERLRNVHVILVNEKLGF